MSAYVTTYATKQLAIRNRPRNGLNATLVHLASCDENGDSVSYGYAWFFNNASWEQQLDEFEQEAGCNLHAKEV